MILIPLMTLKTLSIMKKLIQSLFLFFILLFLSEFSTGTEFANDSDWQCGTPELIESENISRAPKIIPMQDIRPAPQSQVGDQVELYTHIPNGKVRATCRRVGKHAYVFVDNAVANLVAEADLDDIINTFDNRTYPQVHAHLGAEWKPGIDMDARITLLLHDVSGNGSGAGYGGYFSPKDEIPNAPNSNHREIIYIDVYYPTQKRHALHSTIAHEFTHLMNWFQNGGSSDETWLEEGVASFAEWKIYDYVHWIYVENFFNAPSSLVSSNSTDINYGASFLFLLYLYEKYGGKQIIREIVAQDKKGIAAINAALKKRSRTRPEFGDSMRFSDVFNQWAIANFLNDTRQDSLYGYNNNKMVRYRVRPNAKIIERNYPARRAGIIDDWAAAYVIFENPPPTLSIIFDGDSPGIFTAQVIRIDSQGNISHSIIKLDAQNDGVYQADNLEPREKITLIFSSSLSGTCRYEAVANAVNVDFREPKPVETLMDTPLTLTRPVGSQIRKNVAELARVRAIPNSCEFGYCEIQNLGNLHLSSNYTGIFIEGSYAYVTGEWGLEIFDISSGVPRHIGEIPTPGTAENVSVQDGYAYVADGEAGLQIINAQQPEHPQLVTNYRDALAYVHEIQVIGDYAYVADLSEGFQILDISDLGNPHLIGSYKPKGKTFAIHVSGQYAYLADSEDGFQILDISDKKSPKLVGVADITGYDIVTSDDYAYLAYGNFAILDIRNPSAPKIIAEDIQTPGHIVSLQFQDGYIYAADLVGGLAILDVGNVRNPRVIGRQNTAGQAFDVAVKGNYAYIADGYGGLQTIAISPDKIWTEWVNQYDASGFAYAVEVYEGYAYIADGKGGLRIVDVREPSAAMLKFSFPIEGSAYDVKIHDGYAYIAAGESGLFVINIRNFAEPKTVAQIQTSNLAWGVTVSENYVYVAADELWLVDISKPENPKVVAVHQIEGYAYKTLIVGKHAYIAALDGGIQILDITQPEKLKIIGHYDTGDIARSIDVSGNYAYVADSVSGIQVVDISNPQQPQFAGVYLTDAETVDVRVAGGYVYLLGRKSLEILSLQEPELVEQFDDLNWSGGFDINGKLIYVADGYDLKILRFDSKAPWAVDDSVMENSYTTTKSVLRYQLGQNYPNPFNPETWIPYQLAEAADVTISIYNLRGELIRAIKLGRKEAGPYLSKERSAYWDGRNETGERVASGIYFYTMRANGINSSSVLFEATRKMLVWK